MAAAAAGPLLDIALGGLTAISLLPMLTELFPPPDDSSITTRVKIALGDGDLTDGDPPGLSLFDRQGNNIGITPSSGKKMGRGEQRDIDVVQNSIDGASTGAHYMAVAAGGDDAVCVSYMTVTLPDDTYYSWLGDIGYHCGMPWTWGHVAAVADAENGYSEPRCVWLDGDASSGIDTKALGIHLRSFLTNPGRATQYDERRDLLCDVQPRFDKYESFDIKRTALPYFRDDVFNLTTLLDFGDKALDRKNWDTKPIDHKIDGLGDGNGPGVGLGRRRTKRLPPSSKSRGQLRKSSIAYQSARELCDSDSAYGSDFVSLPEGLYCDMETRHLWSVCAEASQHSCFDVEQNRMRLGANNSRRHEASGRVLPRKVYTDVRDW